MPEPIFVKLGMYILTPQSINIVFEILGLRLRNYSLDVAWNRTHPEISNLRVFIYFLFIYLVCEAVGTAATPGLLCQPRAIVKMIVEKQMECRLAGETEVLGGENLSQRHFCPSQNPT
jgi:hypothetical protein